MSTTIAPTKRRAKGARVKGTKIYRHFTVQLQLRYATLHLASLHYASLLAGCPLLAAAYVALPSASGVYVTLGSITAA